jgi:hypothetical protein
MLVNGQRPEGGDDRPYGRFESLTEVRRRKILARRSLIGLRKVKKTVDQIIIDESSSPIKIGEYAPQTILVTPEGSQYVANVHKEFVYNNGNRIPDYTDVFGQVWEVYEAGTFIAGKVNRIRMMLATNYPVVPVPPLFPFAPTLGQTQLMLLTRNPNDPAATDEDIVYAVTNIPTMFFFSADATDYRTMLDTLISVPFETLEQEIQPTKGSTGGNIETPVTFNPIPKLWLAIQSFTLDPNKVVVAEVTLEDGGR